MKIDSIVNKVDNKLIKRLLTNLIELDSQNPPGKCNHIATYLAEESKNLGFNYQIIKLDEEKSNIIISYGTGEKDIFLSSHLDTVPIGDLTQWKYPPLKLTEENGKLFGRGSADDKGGISVLLATIELISRLDIELSHRLVYAGTADEEVGMKGAFNLNSNGFIDNADFVLISEATDLQVGIAEKGPLWFRLKVKGKAAHGSMPEKGKNAIEGAYIGINSLKKIIPEELHVLLGKTTANIGIIQGGTKINIVPEDCYVDIDFRLLPSINHRDFINQISFVLEQITKDYGFNYQMEILHSIPSLETDRNNNFIQNLLKWSNKIALKPQKPIGLTYATDAAALIPPKNIPFAIIGAGSPTVLHQANEFVKLDDLRKASEIIVGALMSTFTD